MNYRHAFHAGNFADVMKHVVLVRILVHLLAKSAPFRVIDTHAGAAWYDLGSGAAARTGEWLDGIGRMDAPFGLEVETLLAPYRAVLDAVGSERGARIYPGSPAIVLALLRRDDRALFSELHPEDHAVLAAGCNSFKQAKAFQLDGWTALKAFIPPKERRGLVLVDPPFEEPGEFARLATELARAVRKWPTGIYLAWYPIKDGAAVEAFVRSLGSLRVPAVRLELMVDRPDPRRLWGSGLIVVNPPWTLASEAEMLLAALAERLGTGGAGFRLEALARAPGETAAPAGSKAAR